MRRKLTEKTHKMMKERFGHDTLLSVATVDGTVPSVRMVNSYYEDGAFYVITYSLSNKMKQIKKCPNVAVCGEWFTAHGIGKNIGHPNDERNAEIMDKLRETFSAWYGNGHTNENDPHTCILRIQLTDGILFDNGKKYDIDFIDD